MLTPPGPYQIRSMQLADLPEVRTIEQLSLPTPTKVGTYEYELTQNELAHYQVLVVNGRNIIGYSGYWLIADEVHISIVAIHPDWRRHGLGELLLLNMIAITTPKAVTLATLEVRASNTAAQSLYHKYNFHIVNERPRYYRDGESALVMTADLPLPNFEEVVTVLLSRFRNEGKPS